MTTPRATSGAQGRTPHAGESGWALVETLVSAVLLIVVSLAIASSLDTASRASGESKQRSAAATLAEQDQERMRGMDPTTLSNYHPPARNVTTADGGVYTIASRADWIRDSTNAPESCTTNSTQADYLRITSTVTSRLVGTDIKPVTSAGIVTPAVGAFGPGLGTLSVSVVDRNGAPVPNMIVTTSGTKVLSDSTNSLGCAVFAYIPIGGYTATASAGGWVDRDGNPTATASATVSQGTVASVQLVYDQAGALAVSLDGAAPATTKLNVGQPAFPTPRTLTSTITPNAPTVFANLFPFATSKYNAYVGSCTDADPSKYSEPVASTLVAPGPATALNVHLPPISIKVTKNGAPLTTAATVKITSTTAGCSNDVQAVNLNASASGVGSVPMPYGHYKVCADLVLAGISRNVTVTGVNNITSAGPAQTALNINTTSSPTGGCP